MTMDKSILVITDASPIAAIIADPHGDRAVEYHGSRGSEDTGGGFGTRGEASSLFKTVSLNADGLKGQIANLLEVVQYVFDQPLSRAALTLDEVTLSAEITSEGEIRILGSGGKLAGRGAVNLVFKRKPVEAAAPDSKGQSASDTF